MRPRHPLRIAAIAAAAVAVAATGLHHVRVAAKWAEMERMADRLRAELDGRDFARPALAGPPTSGNAWDEYRAAVDALPKGIENQVDAILDARRRGATWRPARRVARDSLR